MSSHQKNIVFYLFIPWVSFVEKPCLKKSIEKETHRIPWRNETHSDCCRTHTGEFLFFVQTRLVYWIQLRAKSTGKLAIIVHTGKLAIVVHTGKLAIIVHTGKLAIIVHTGKLAIIVHTGKLAIIVHTGKLAIIVHTGKFGKFAILEFLSARFAKFQFISARFARFWVHIGKIRQVLSSYRQDSPSFEFVAARFANFWVLTGKVCQILLFGWRPRKFIRQVCPSLLIVNEPIF
jgi:hypothetical protein